MSGSSETPTQRWRAVAIFDDRPDALILFGHSSTQVRAQYIESLLDLLDEEERAHIVTIQLEQWKGDSEAGCWVKKSSLKVPPIKSPIVVANGSPPATRKKSAQSRSASNTPPSDPERPPGERKESAQGRTTTYEPKRMREVESKPARRPQADATRSQKTPAVLSPEEPLIEQPSRQPTPRRRTRSVWGYSRPLIGINTDYRTETNAASYLRIDVGYVDAVLAGGGLPVLLPPLRKENFAEIETLLGTVAGVMLTGGHDIDPQRHGQATTAEVVPIAIRREDADQFLLAWVFEHKVPVLGIGLGMQQLNVFAGGTLHLHLPRNKPKAMPHFDRSGAPHRHIILIEPTTRLSDIYGDPELRVNSTHHQAVKELGKGMRVAAKAPDGVIEAIEATDPDWFCVGVQWHPEAHTASALDVQLFECFIQTCAREPRPVGVA